MLYKSYNCSHNTTTSFCMHLNLSGGIVGSLLWQHAVGQAGSGLAAQHCEVELCPCMGTLCRLHYSSLVSLAS